MNNDKSRARRRQLIKGPGKERTKTDATTRVEPTDSEHTVEKTQRKNNPERPDNTRS